MCNKYIIGLIAAIASINCGGGFVRGTAIRSPDGSNWVGIECHNTPQIDCFAEAGNQCPGGYDIVDNTGHFSEQADFVMIGKYTSASEKEVHSGEMIIKCHGPSRQELLDAADGYDVYSSGAKAKAETCKSHNFTKAYYRMHPSETSPCK